MEEEEEEEAAAVEVTQNHSSQVASIGSSKVYLLLGTVTPCLMVRHSDTMLNGFVDESSFTQ